MRKSPRRLMQIASTIFVSFLVAACDPPRIVVSHVNTFCTSVDRYHATQAQRDAFKADPPLWESMVNWLAGVDKTWDDECLKPAPGN